MLLIQALEVNSEFSEAYKMGFLAKTVNGLKLILGSYDGGAYTGKLRFYFFRHLD